MLKSQTMRSMSSFVIEDLRLPSYGSSCTVDTQMLTPIHRDEAIQCRCKIQDIGREYGSSFDAYS